MCFNHMFISSFSKKARNIVQSDRSISLFPSITSNRTYKKKKQSSLTSLFLKDPDIIKTKLSPPS